MQVNTVWASHEMHHQNGRIMQMQFAHCRVYVFFFFIKGVFPFSVVWPEYKLTTESDLRDEVKYKVFTGTFQACMWMNEPLVYLYFSLFIHQFDPHFNTPHPSVLYYEKHLTKPPRHRVFCLYLFLFFIQFNSVYIIFMKNQVQQLHRNTTFIPKPFLAKKHLDSLKISLSLFSM